VVRIALCRPTQRHGAAGVDTAASAPTTAAVGLPVVGAPAACRTGECGDGDDLCRDRR
jgi:hypothetical protein